MKSWTQKDQRESLAFGWGIFERYGFIEIERFDDGVKFRNDNEARKHVLELAFRATNDVKGASVYHERELCRKAITYLIIHH